MASAAERETMGIDQDSFKSLFRSRPVAVSVVTALDMWGHPHGLTTTAVCEVSKSPALLLACLDHGSRTLAAIEQTGGFAVNFLTAGRDALSETFAGKGEDKFAAVRWRASAVGGAPLLVADSIAYAACAVSERIRAGDHTIVVGRIEEAATLADVPLMYFRGRYPAWPAGPRMETVPPASQGG
jgi:flavin reductase (DIM6/NTAB) family NADH-FMN oxidoreductase RutF